MANGDSTAAVTLDDEGDRVVLTLHQPARKNAVNGDMWRRLTSLTRSIAANGDVRIVLVRGHGEHAFSAGADITEFDGQRSGARDVRAYDDLVEQACTSLEAVPVPTLAMIHGVCVGAGLSIACSCDLRLCDDRAKFALPAARLGLGYDFAGIERLVRVVGMPAAKHILFTGGVFDASRALQIGLVHQISPTADLARAVEELTDRIRHNAPLSLRAMKACFGELRKPPEQRTLESCEALVERCNASADYQEGRNAFAERRTPVFRGR